jgi:ABC-type sugar transport system ATPase subunit
MAAIELQGIGKSFGARPAILSGIDIAIADGERLVIVGPSGSGKSTLLRIIAGLEAPTEGRVRIGERDVTDVPPERRDLAMVFQSYALYPHKTVRDNLAFGLRVRRVEKDEIERRVEAVAASLGLDGLLDRMPAQLSGGQRQRVALGRAIVREPQAFLFDEPLSNLDPRLRGDTRAELVELHARFGATMIYVTHDQEEAMTLGQRIAVLRAGRLEQIAPPRELYARPATIFVAQFVGSPPMNVIEAARLDGLVAVPRGASAVGIRPHDLRIVRPGEPAPIRGRVTLVESLGHEQIVRVETDVGRLTAATPPDPTFEPGAAVAVAIAPAALHGFTAAGERV